MINVLHFPGTTRKVYHQVFKSELDKVILEEVPELDIISCWTDDNDCILYQQLKKQNINLINAYPGVKVKSWDMRNKIKWYIDTLERSDKDICLLLDGYDVLLVSLDNIIEKFKSSGTRILFNSTKANYPRLDIEYIENREQYGYDHWLNAGCCIGYRQDLINFYKEALSYFKEARETRSEQHLIRLAFKNHTKEEVWVDFDRLIFSTLGTKDIIIVNDYQYLLVL